MLLSSFVTTNFTAAEINEREIEVRKLLDASPIVFSYGYGADPHDPYSMLVEKPEPYFEEILGRCLLKSPHQPPVYLIGKLETRIEGASRPFTFHTLLVSEALGTEGAVVLELVKASLYDRALSFFVEKSLIENPSPEFLKRHVAK